MRPKRSVADLKKDFEDLKNGMKNLPTSAARMELLVSTSIVIFALFVVGNVLI